MAGPKRSTTYKIGITGNICSGKTLVRNTLARFGINTMDAEEMAMNLLADNPLRLNIRLTDHFGGEVLDSRGRLSKRKLKHVLYADPEKKALFEEKLDPLIRDETKKFLYSPMGSYIRAVEVPLLLETDTSHLYDEVWVVTSTIDLQTKYLMAREHLGLEDAQRIVMAQWQQEKKAGMGDRVIDNSGDIHHTESQVRKAHDEIKNRTYKII